MGTKELASGGQGIDFRPGKREDKTDFVDSGLHFVRTE